MRLESEDPELPGITIGLRKERRMFSRSWPLVIESTMAGTGPGEPLSLGHRRRPFRRATGLEPMGAGRTEASEAWAHRFEDAGLLRGASEMTSVQDLTVSWRPHEAAWTLRLRTLAGSMIGTAPGSSISVPFEPNDVRGLLIILRAFRAVIASRP